MTDRTEPEADTTAGELIEALMEIRALLSRASQDRVPALIAELNRNHAWWIANRAILGVRPFVTTHARSFIAPADPLSNCKD